MVLWSNIEAALGRAVLSLGYVDDLDAARLMVAELNMRSRISVLKGICHIEMTELDYNIAEAWLNHIDSYLRNYRNRLIHDEWSVDILEILLSGDFAYRDTVQTKVVKQPGAAKRLLQTLVTSTVYAKDIVEFCRDLDDARNAISRFIYYTKERGFGERLPPLACRYKSLQQLLREGRDRDQIQG